MDDLEHWNLSDEFTGHQAAALAVGLEPGRFYDDRDEPTGFRSPAYDSVAAAMRRAYDEAVNLVDVMATWGDRSWTAYCNEWQSPAPLRSNAMHSVIARVVDDLVVPIDQHLATTRTDFCSAVFSRDELLRWFKAREPRFTPKYSFASDAQSSTAGAAESQFGSSAKPLTTTERNTLLSVIAAMAVNKYRFDPTPGARLEMLGTLRADCEKVGVSVSDDTLRAKLREAFALLPEAAPRS